MLYNTAMLRINDKLIEYSTWLAEDIDKRQEMLF